MGIASEEFFFVKFDNFILMPLKNAFKRGGAKWNKAYQAVKHDRHNSLKDGNIGNLVNALGSLYILNIYYADRGIKLGVTQNPVSDFDRRLGSDIFYVGIADATEITLGTKNNEVLISEGLKLSIQTAIYVIKYTEDSFKAICNGMNKNINSTKEFEKNSVYYQQHLHINEAEIEAVLAKNETIYNIDK